MHTHTHTHLYKGLEREGGRVFFFLKRKIAVFLKNIFLFYLI